MNTLTKLRTLRDFLSQFRFNFTSEDELQIGIAQALQGTSFKAIREYRVSDEDRLDFLIDGEIALETKIGGSPASVMRQISKYAQYDEIKAILLVTNRPGHKLSHAFNGKPLLVHSLMDGAF